MANKTIKILNKEANWIIWRFKMVLGIISVVIGLFFFISSLLFPADYGLIASIFIVGGFIMLTIEKSANKSKTENHENNEKNLDSYENLKEQFENTNDDQVKRLIARKLVNLGHKEYKIHLIGS